MVKDHEEEGREEKRERVEENRIETFSRQSGKASQRDAYEMSLGRWILMQDRIQ